MTEAQHRYRTLKAAGLCTGCKGEPLPGFVRCRACLDAIHKRRSAKALAHHRRQAREMIAAKRAERVANGRCSKCNAINREPTWNCLPCRREESQRRRKHPSCKRPCGYCRELGHNRKTCEVFARDLARARSLEYAASRAGTSGEG